MNPSSALIDQIIARRKQELSKKLQSYPRAMSVLSDISECERQMVYSVLDWKDRQMFDEEVAARLEAGNVQEREIIGELIRMGFKVILSQQPVDITGKNGRKVARGKIDGMIEFERFRIPFEIKSMNPNIFNSIKSIDDFQRKPHLRKYLRQMQMYLFGNNLEEGIFILTDCLGHIKLLSVFLDYGECEAILLKLERVDMIVEKLRNVTDAEARRAQYPDRIVYDSSICGHCPFSRTCLPDMTNQPAELVIDEVIEGKVARHEELKPLASEYDDLHDELKLKFAKVAKAIIGDKFILQNLPSKKTSYILPEEVEKFVEEIYDDFKVIRATTRMLIQRLDKKLKGGQ